MRSPALSLSLSRQRFTEAADPVKSLSRMVWDRTVPRHFEADDVPLEDVRTMLALATEAPSAFNLQPWRFVVVRSQEQRDRLQVAAAGHCAVAEAPVVIVAYGRRREWGEYAAETVVASAEEHDGSGAALTREEELERALEYVRRQDISLWLTRQVMVAFTYLMVGAEALGWDTLPMEDFDPAHVAEVLELPADAEVVAMLAVGRIRSEQPPSPPRLPLERVVRADRYDTMWVDPLLSGF